MLETLANLDFMSVIPAIVAIFLAFRYKNVYFSLGFGLYIGLVIISLRAGHGLLSFFDALLQIPVFMISSLADSWNAGIVMQVLLIGGLVVLISYTGGLQAMATSLSKYGKTRMSAQLITWLMGILIFFDGIANALIVGPSMRPITDKANVSREKLSFIIDSTASPITGLVIISTWFGFEISLITEQLQNLHIENTNAMHLFLGSLPFRFYNILMLIFILLTIFTAREFGPMLKAEKKTKNYQTHSAKEIVDSNDYCPKAYEGVIPLLILIISSFILFFTNGLSVMVSNGSSTLDNGISLNLIIDAFSNANASIVITQASVLAIISSLIISTKRGAFKFSEGLNITFEGAATLLPTIFILLFAWSLGDVMNDTHLNAGNYISKTLGTLLPFQFIPLLIFLTAALTSFATGTSFGTMGLIFPLAMPLAWSANQDIPFLTVTIGAILTGAIVGDHCSPISDTTILSSAGCDVDHLDHVSTQLPYALSVGAVASICYLLAGFGINPFVLIILASIFLLLILQFLGEKIH